MSFFINDIKKLCGNRLFLFALAVLLFCAVYDPLFMAHRYEMYQNPFMWWMFMNMGTGSTIYNTLYWVFPVLLTGMVLYDEKNSAIYGIMLTKGKRAAYFLSKLCSVMLVTFLCITGIFLLNLVLVYVFCSVSSPIEEYLVPKAGSFARPLFENSPFLMAFIYNILHASAMTLLTALYVCIQMVFKFKNKYIALLVPPLLMHALDFALQVTGLMEYSLTILIQPVAASASTELLRFDNLIFVYGGMLAAIMIGLVVGIGRNRDVL